MGESYNNLRTQRRNSCLCPECGVLVTEDKTYCLKCTARKNETDKKYKANRRKNSLCLYCGEPSSKTYCPICVVKRNENGIRCKYERREKGLCVRCGKKRSESKNKNFCLKCTEHINQQAVKRKKKQKQIVFERYGNKCSCLGCPETNTRFLTIDHINNDGRKHRNMGKEFYKWIIKNNYPDDLQLLCWNCNSGRAQNNGICPHVEQTLIIC